MPNINIAKLQIHVLLLVLQKSTNSLEKRRFALGSPGQTFVTKYSLEHIDLLFSQTFKQFTLGLVRNLIHHITGPVGNSSLADYRASAFSLTLGNWRRREKWSRSSKFSSGTARGGTSWVASPATSGRCFRSRKLERLVLAASCYLFSSLFQIGSIKGVFISSYSFLVVLNH